ncbi:MAG: tetratricopeptide repeat protein [Granulosicoccus sp.]|nr:tetratricopeptide repeat protein [Granulosicoccus sp.]
MAHPKSKVTSQDLQSVVDRHLAGDLVTAKREYLALIKNRQANSTVYLNLADILYREQEVSQAVEYIRDALALNPDNVNALFNLGIMLEKLNPAELDESISCYRKVIKQVPDHADAYCAMGSALTRQNKSDEAIRSLEKTIALQPDHKIANHTLGSLRFQRREYDKAKQCFGAAVKADSRFYHAASEYWHTSMHMCDWSEFDQLSQSVNIMAQESSNSPEFEQAISPFQLINLIDDPALLRQVTENYMRHNTSVSATGIGSCANTSWSQEELIKVAFISGDFRAHATGYLMAEILEIFELNPAFELHVISFGVNDNSILRQRIEGNSRNFTDLEGHSDYQIAEKIADLGIHIAVDVSGLTTVSRPGIFELRPAPIQVHYLAYPGTCGSKNIDYLIADEYVIPEAEQKHYSESLMYMPGCYQVSDRKRPHDDASLSRKSFGLPDKGFVFCCFSSNYKITPAIFDVWMELLDETPGSVLWLLEDNQWSRSNLVREAESRGINPERLIFAPKIEIGKHLARIRFADLFLDTSPCGAHTTANDALWAGLPVVALVGRGFASRVAGSVLSAVGMESLITDSLSSYKNLISELVKDPSRLEKIRGEIEKNKKTCSLFNTELFVKDMHKGFIQMMLLHDAGKQPETFSVSELEDELPSNISGTEEEKNPDQSIQATIVLVHPEQDSGLDFFNSAVEGLYYSLQQIGFTTNLTHGEYHSDGINILLGVHLLNADELTDIPDGTIIFNTEMLSAGTSWLSDAHQSLFNRSEIWDARGENVNYLRESGIGALLHFVPIGYVPEFTRLPKPVIQDVDVTVFGHANDRSVEIVRRLKEAGAVVQQLSEVSAIDRENIVSRSKVMLYVGTEQEKEQELELIKYAFLWSNKKAIVCEFNSPEIIDSSISSAVKLVPYDSLVEQCQTLLSDTMARYQLEEAGFCYVLEHELIVDVREALIATADQSGAEPVETAVLDKLNVGNTGKFKEDCLNIDISDRNNPDVVFDLSLPLAEDPVLECERFGRFELANNTFTRIFANDQVSLVEDLVTFMTNCLNLLQPEGELHISVPYDLSGLAWTGPRYRRSFNENSWHYYYEKYSELGWTDAFFETKSIDVSLSESGELLSQAGLDTDAILATPRAVDTITVVLVKREISAAEKQLTGQVGV